MDKNAIKKYAVWARRELISRVSQKALQYCISAENTGDPDADNVNGRLLAATERKQRQALIRKVQEQGYEQVMEEVAYTWFNRFAALRFMEVNGYLPSHVRVFTDDNGEFRPQILAEAIHLDLDGLNMDRVYELKNANNEEELFKYLLITQCNALGSILPGMFQRIADYTELLFPDNLLREGSVIQQMVELIPEEDWLDQVQITGWLYQYYNAELNDLVYDGSFSKKRISKDLLPAATTIYTPDWAVHYMVENSLGRLWMEGHPNDELQAQWKYYLEEPVQEPEVQTQLAEIHKEYAVITPDQIKCIDPCAGSGHIIAYLFDVLIQIYEDYGYTNREAVTSIVENNIYGLDIDDRAAQLAYFAVMMKARQYDRRFFSRGIQPHVYAIGESNHVDQNVLTYFVGDNFGLKTAMNTIIRELHDAKEYGSILTVTRQDWAALYARFDEIRDDTSVFRDISIQTLLPLVQTAETLSQQYWVICTNPPYLGNSRFSIQLDKYVKEYYTDAKSDLSMAMYNHALKDMCNANGFISFITTSSWMFISSFEKLRKDVLSSCAFESVVDFGTELFDGKVGHNPIVAWVNRNVQLNTRLTAVRLVDYCYSRRDEKESEFFLDRNRYTICQSNFSKIPGSPVAYWVGNRFCENYKNRNIASYAEVITGMTIGDNNKYLRAWYEPVIGKLSIGKKSMNEVDMSYSYWIPYSKGGQRRNWYGNYEYVVNWSQHQYFNRSKTTLKHLYLRKAITWPFITSGLFSARLLPQGFLWDVAGSPCFFDSDDEQYYALGFLCSKIANYILKVVNPTINVQAIDISNLPLIIDNALMASVVQTVVENINISRQDWDSFETSWDFRRHPLVPSSYDKQEQFSSQFAQSGMEQFSRLSWHYDNWERDCEARFRELQENEEELNRIFIDIYGLQDELTPEVEDKDVTVRKADLSRDIRSFISYAVGCMFGRYSLYKDGLIFAGEPYSLEAWVDKMNDQPGTISHEELVRAYHNEGVVVDEMFYPDKDNIIPICDDEYFEDDIVGRFVDFVRTVYGEETLEENLQFIADALGGKGQPRDIIRSYFLNDFYADHCKIYQKRPIYWMFDSGKKNGFKALIYMHRYQPDTIARIRTDYVHEQQSRYRTAIEDLGHRMEGCATSERVRLGKQLKRLQEQAAEIHTYEERIHHLADQMISIDLDDGVKHNYAIFQDVLAWIK